MKKIIILTFVLLITVTSVLPVCAVTNFEISLQSSKSEVEKGEEFVVDVKISNIQIEKGIIAIRWNIRI